MPERRTDQLHEHEQADLVPAMTTDEYAALVAHIRENGIRVPLELTAAGKVLDGRNRLRAARDLGLPTVPVVIADPKDELEHMVSAALHRRSLSPSQRAALILSYEAIVDAEAQARERRLANLRPDTDVAALPHRGERTRDLAARLAGVSPRTIQAARQVRAADPELFEDVRAGQLTVNKAAKIVERRQRYAAIPPPRPCPTAPSR